MHAFYSMFLTVIGPDRKMTCPVPATGADERMASSHKERWTTREAYQLLHCRYGASIVVIGVVAVLGCGASDAGSNDTDVELEQRFAVQLPPNYRPLGVALSNDALFGVAWSARGEPILRLSSAGIDTNRAEYAHDIAAIAVDGTGFCLCNKIELSRHWIQLAEL
jgi:hypothetical protein